MNTHRWFLALALMVAWLAGVALGQTNTVGGTVIENTATATFVDSNDVTRSTFSNTVATIVQTVYSFDVAPDDGRVPTSVTDFTGYTETDGLNDASGAIGDTVEFEYTITNDTNNDASMAGSGPVNLSLSVVQDTADDFDLIDVAIEVSFDSGATYVPYDPGAGIDLTSQGQQVLVRVTGEIPAGVDGNDVALIDLVAINTTAVAAGQIGPNVSFETNNVARTTVDEAPSIGVAKAVAGPGPVNNGDGTYTVSYLITVANLGNVPLSGVQVTDDLAATFAGATGFAVTGVVAATGTLSANAAYDGTTDTQLLDAAGSTLAIGATQTITFTVTVTPGADLGPYDNSAVAEGTSPNDVDTSDTSVPGTTPDPDAAAPTPVTFTEAPSLGVAKAASAAVDAAGFPGEFLTTITLTLVNYGDVELRNVQVTDVLEDTFPGPVTFVVTAAPSGTLTGNGAAFTGVAGPGANVLAGTDTLAAGATATVAFEVRFNPNGATGPFLNSAVASGTSPAGTLVEDDSHLGADPAPGGGENPGDFGDPTPITFTEAPRIGVAKDGTITDFGPAGVGPFTAQIDFLLRNYGNVALSNVTLTDDLDAAFGAGNYAVTAGPSLLSASAGAIINVNAGYDGGADTEIIADGSGSFLPIGGDAVVRIEVRIDTAGTYTNQATGTGTGPGGGTNTDLSNAGTDPDPDDDGNPNNNETPTTWSVDELALAKTARTCADAACASVLSATGGTVEPGQYLEYTIVATATGDLDDVEVIDEIPADTIYVLGSISAGGECSTNGGASYGACPTTASGPYTDANATVTHVRWTQANLLNSASLTLEFVVRVR